MADREILCPYCHEIFLLKSHWTTSEIMCGSCGQIIDMEKFKKKKEGKGKEKGKEKKAEKQKLNHNATREWLHGRMAIVPTPGKMNLGGKKANKLPMLTGVANVLDSDEEEEERIRKQKKKEEKKKRKQQQKQQQQQPQPEEEEEQEEAAAAAETPSKAAKTADDESDDNDEDNMAVKKPRKKRKTKTKKKKRADDGDDDDGDDASDENEQEQEVENTAQSGVIRRNGNKQKTRDANAGYVKRGRNGKNPKKTAADVDDKMEEKAEPLRQYNAHNVSNKHYTINNRPKDDDSDEWEEIPMEEEVVVSKPKTKAKAKQNVEYFDNEDDVAQQGISHTQGMDLQESDEDEDDGKGGLKKTKASAAAAGKKRADDAANDDDDESSSDDEYFKRRQQRKQNAKKNKK